MAGNAVLPNKISSNWSSVLGTPLSNGQLHHLGPLSSRWGSAFVSYPFQTFSCRRTGRIVCGSMEPYEKSETHLNTLKLEPESHPENSQVEKQFWTWNVIELLDRIADYADAQTEMGVKKRRAFYKADDWVQHRSSKRHLKHIMSTFSSRVIISLIPPVAALTSIAAVFATYNSVVDAHMLPRFFPLLHLSPLPHQLTAPALALLLVFRTEASYSRYDESRKTWTKVFACTKDFSRQCLAWIDHPQDSNRKKDLQQYIMAFPVALKCHVLDGSDLKHDLEQLLDEEDLAVVMSSQHRPNCLIQLMTQSLGRLQIGDSTKGLMDTNITQFNESVSVCERIMRTPIPLSYTRLTSRALILWHLTLPFCLWDECKWFVVFATFFSACTLFCIEEVGVLIEEPFPILSLDKMCAAAHQSVEEFVELQSLTDKHLKSKDTKLSNPAVSGRVTSNGVLPTTSLS